jgi:hypothetical protein
VINDSNKIILQQNIKDKITKIKVNGVLDFFSRLSCGISFKARQTIGSDLTSIHLATPLHLYFLPNVLELMIKPTSTSAKFLNLGLETLNPK